MPDDLNDYASRNLDSPTRHISQDSVSGDPIFLGFNCVASDGCLLTFITAQGDDQVTLSREQAEWLLADGLPALLAEMESLSDGNERGS